MPIHLKRLLTLTFLSSLILINPCSSSLSYDFNDDASWGNNNAPSLSIEDSPKASRLKQKNRAKSPASPYNPYAMESISDSNEPVITQVKAKKKPAAANKATPKRKVSISQAPTEEDSDLQGDGEDLISLMSGKKAEKKPAAVKKRGRPAKTEEAAPLQDIAPVLGNLPHSQPTDKILKLSKLVDAFKNKTVMVVDFETASFSPRIGGRAISLGIIMIVNGTEQVRWEAIFNPDRDSNKGAFKAHGISRSVTRTKPRFHEVTDEIASLLNRADAIVAHNAKFDHRYMKAEFERAAILKTLQRRSLDKLISPNCPLKAHNKEFIQTQLNWINETPNLADKRLFMFQSRLTTALWLYLFDLETILKGDLFDETTGKFGIPFLPTPKSQGKSNVTGYTKAVNNALFHLYAKMTELKGLTKSDKDYIKWKKFESIDLSKYGNFTKDEIRRKSLFDKQIRAVSIVKKFTFLELEWDKVYNWQRVGEETSVFYNKTDRTKLDQISNYMNLAKDLVESHLFKTPELPRFLDYVYWVDTYALAKEVLHQGQDISRFKLDTLCDFYNISRESRNDGHGALIDSVLLAHVYANLKGTEFKEVAANNNKPILKAPTKKAKVNFSKDKDDSANAPFINDDAPGDQNDLIGGIF